MDQPTIGILLNDRTYHRIIRGRTSHEAVHLYELAASRLNCRVCYFRMKDISLRHRRVKALFLEQDGSQRRIRLIPLPDVIHNRAIHLARGSRRKLASLQAAGVFLYNRHNRYGKWLIHRLLMKDDRIRPHLPETRLATARSIREMMRRYDALIIKPNNGSIGRGIMKLQKIRKRWRLHYRSAVRRRRWLVARSSGRVPAVLLRAIRRRSYLVQERIALASYMGRPFDLRVSVQRNRSGEWQVTGIIGKAAPARLFLTNVAQGGTVYTLEHLLHAHPALHPMIVRRDIEVLALRIAACLSETLPNLADLGMDIGITEQGVPMFIECNCRDLRYSFQEGGLTDVWAEVYQQPISYGRSVWLHRQAARGVIMNS